MGERLQLKDCARYTPSAQVPKRRSNLRLSFLHTVDDKEVNTQSYVETIIKETRVDGNRTIKLQFSTIDKHNMHPQEGISLICHDQMNIIATHLEDIKANIEDQGKNYQHY